MAHNTSFIRTDKAITQAFIDLLKEKSFEKITVQDILDRTPVTRATFYAHYHDKYEIAEKMMDQFLQNRDQVRLELRNAPPSKLLQITKKALPHNQDLAEALMKIHTEKVNLRQTIVDEFEEFYMAATEHNALPLEARIYAQARAELELSHFYDNTPLLSFENTNDMFLNVFLHLLRLSDDEETMEFLQKKLSQKFYSKK